MYKWLKEYFTAFGKDFPFSAVADLNEYEIIRIIQYCIKTNTEYKADTEEQIKSESDETFAGQRISHMANETRTAKNKLYFYFAIKLINCIQCLVHDIININYKVQR